MPTAPVPGPLLHLEPHPSANGHAPTLVVTGEVDIATADALRTALEDLRVGAPGHDLRLECAGLDFIDSSGLSVLAETRKELARDGRRLVLANLGTSQREIFAVSGLDQVLVLE